MFSGYLPASCVVFECRVARSGQVVCSSQMMIDLCMSVIVMWNVAVNGNWGSWTEWGSCTLSCGGGTRVRSRGCDSPAPSRNGRYCVGSDRQIDYCNKDDCPGLTLTYLLT